MKEPTFEDRAGFTLLGVGERIVLEQADWKALWAAFERRMADIAPVALGEACYGAYFDAGDPKASDFLAGMMIPAGTAAKEGLVARDVPEARYAVFECSMEEIGPTWHRIFGEWLPGSGYRYVEGNPCFEEFAPGVMEGNVPVRIFVPVTG
ncbi:MAG: GyrI-like domain-containing protein [Fimbriimonadia bacterium]|jgi:predicted transcriptional regulator YdeE